MCLFIHNLPSLVSILMTMTLTLYQINCLHLSHSVFFWGSILFLQLKHVPLLPHFAWLFVSVYYANQLWLPVLKEWLCVGDELYCLTFS